LVYTKDPIKYI